MKLMSREVADLHELARIEWRGSPDMLLAIDAAYRSHLGFLAEVIQRAGHRRKKPYLPKSFVEKLSGAV